MAWIRGPRRKNDYRKKGGRGWTGDPVWIDDRTPRPAVPRRERSLYASFDLRVGADGNRRADHSFRVRGAGSFAPGCIVPTMTGVDADCVDRKRDYRFHRNYSCKRPRLPRCRPSLPTARRMSRTRPPTAVTLKPASPKGRSQWISRGLLSLKSSSQPKRP